MYFDKYRDKKYGVIRSRDLAYWEEVSEQLVLPTGIRHGTVLQVPRAVVEGLKQGRGRIFRKAQPVNKNNSGDLRDRISLVRHATCFPKA